MGFSGEGDLGIFETGFEFCSSSIGLDNYTSLAVFG